jgi:hypothetical protein
MRDARASMVLPVNGETEGGRPDCAYGQNARHYRVIIRDRVNV